MSFYKITAVKGGVEQESVASTFGTKTTQLQGGAWHLISFPFTITNNQLGNETVYGKPVIVSPAGAIKSIYRYNSTSQVWESVDYQAWGWKQAVGSEDFLALEEGIGYWFEMNQNASITYTGKLIETNFNRTLKAGWNLVGPVFNENIALPTGGTSDTYPFTMSPADNMFELYEYDTNAVGDFYSTTYFQDWGWFPIADISSVKPNTAYYLDMNIDTTWLVGQ